MTNDAAGLPLVAAACLCEKVLHERDDVFSLVRIVDRFFVGAPPDVIERVNPHLSLTLVLMLKGNGQTGKHQVAVQLHGPTRSEAPQIVDVEFSDDPLAGYNIVVQSAIGVVKNFGSMRFDVTYDGRYLTTVPFRVEQKRPEQTDTAREPQP